MMRTKLIVLAVLLTFLGAFAPIDNAAARPRCPKVWIEGHRNQYGRWIRPHWQRQHWVPGHYNPGGRWIPGHCR